MAVSPVPSWVFAVILINNTDATKRAIAFNPMISKGLLQRLINQYTIHVEQYYKADNNKWIFSKYSNSQDSLNLASIACQISLEDIYNKVNFEAKE